MCLQICMHVHGTYIVVSFSQSMFLFPWIDIAVRRSMLDFWNSRSLRQQRRQAYCCSNRDVQEMNMPDMDMAVPDIPETQTCCPRHTRHEHCCPDIAVSDIAVPDMKPDSMSGMYGKSRCLAGSSNAHAWGLFFIFNPCLGFLTSF